MSSGSGIPPSAATLALIDELRKNSSKYLFATFKIQGTEIVPDSSYPSSDADAKEFQALRASGDEAVAKVFEKDLWTKFVNFVTAADGPRFAIVDFYSINTEGRIIRQLVSVGWCSDKTKAKDKMTFASTKTSFEGKINIGKKYQANDQSDLEYQTVYDSITSK